MRKFAGISRSLLILNVAGFQLAWLTCVLGAANHSPWIGPATVATLAAIHLHNATRPLREAGFLLLGTSLGCLLDQSMLSAGWTAYPVASSWPQNLLPLWMVALWLGFCTTVNVSMRWLRGHPVLAILLGAVGAPITYGSGIRLGAMTWVHPMFVIPSLSVAFG
ncbi:MAG: DUF2878 domain-containing protein, partial [Steroidobacterales bacterium]